LAERILVALGGHTMIRPGQDGTIPEQLANLREALGGVVELIRLGHRLIVTHGNGPQIGHILVRAEQSRGKAYAIPLDVCVAQSQGEMGYLIQKSLREVLRASGVVRSVCAIVTTTVVDRNDPRMRSPTKPIGPFYTKESADLLKKERNAFFVEDAHRGYRRVVPSPLPLEIIEKEVIRKLFDDGVIVVAAGGGGVPVCVAEDGTLAGVEAVVDKDLASSLLATDVGVEKILDLTGVENVSLNFASSGEKPLLCITVSEAKRYLAEGHFLPGSMEPKIEAAIRFLDRGGREFVITTPDKALEALRGKAGTHIFPDAIER
jgi:carbamate kinase